MAHKDEVKKDVLKSINYARDHANSFLEKDIDCKDITGLTNVLSATEEATTPKSLPIRRMSTAFS